MIRKKIVRKNGCFECFRLLNSEIGNDQQTISDYGRKCKSFRLLNSEIGNDLSTKSFISNTAKSFRLLNSEIGNDRGTKNERVSK